jgi:hypothetical protein
MAIFKRNRDHANQISRGATSSLSDCIASWRFPFMWPTILKHFPLNRKVKTVWTATTRKQNKTKQKEPLGDTKS